MQALLNIALCLIAGLVFGKLAKFIHLPNVTGYLIGGLIVGPSILNIINEDIIVSLDFISSVALGFIAFSIGSEFKASYFKRVGVIPIVIAIFEALTAVFLVIIVLIIAGFDIPFSIVLGAIAAATAPAATIMVIRQYKAKGPLTETLLSVVALDDAVALIAFGIAVAIATMLNHPGEGSMIGQLVEPLIEIGGSLVIGAILGFIFTISLKIHKLRDNRQILIYVYIFIALYISSIFGLSDLLTCMAMGAVLCNIYNDSDKIMEIADTVTPPIFMLFFVLSGADLKLSILPSIGLVGVIYIVVRSIGKIIGATVGAKISKAENCVQKYLGFALLPQAGVAIGLTVVAKTVVPEYAETIRAVVLCGTLIYELIGPSIAKWSLKQAGEIKEA